MVQLVDEGSERRLRSLLAEGRYQEVLERFPPASIGDPTARPGLALGVATAATRLGALEPGMRLATGALDGYQLRIDEDGRMRCLNLLGAIAYERGQLGLAATMFAASLELSRSLKDLQSWARASNNLASVALQQGRLEESASLYREVAMAYQRLGDRRGLAEASHNLGVASRELGQLAQAGRLGEQAVRHAELVGDPALLALAITGQAETTIAEGALTAVAEGLDRAERLAREAGDALGVAEVERVRAERWLRLGEFSPALAAAESARATAERFGSSQLQGECAALAMRAALRLKQPAEIARYRAEAERLFDALGGVLHLARLQAAAEA
ncbi:MAG TPA: tetratricopeptide repeat protein [Gemmatimonadales bacterium]|nr:tetratricopeptide repeat protein [Gemmatimonadales bacterium]